MRSGDLIDILCEYGDMPMKITGPGGNPLAIQRIESVGDELHIELGYWNLSSNDSDGPDQSKKTILQIVKEWRQKFTSVVAPAYYEDPIGWQPDVTGV